MAVLRGSRPRALDVRRCQRSAEHGTVTWHPEFASYMLETTPGAPYGGSIKDFLHVEGNMRLRRIQAASVLPAAASLVTMTTFPRLGCPGFTHPEVAPAPDGGISNSLFFPDQAMNNSHPRFATLATNIRQRRTRKVAMNVPSETEWPGHPRERPWRTLAPVPLTCSPLPGQAALTPSLSAPAMGNVFSA